MIFLAPLNEIPCFHILQHYALKVLEQICNSENKLSNFSERIDELDKMMDGRD